MKGHSMVVFLAVLGAGGAWADLKPDIVDCNAKKAARNAAMEATTGVSGRCDADKLAKDAKDDVVDGAKDVVDVDLDKKPLDRDRDKGKLRDNKD